MEGIRKKEPKFLTGDENARRQRISRKQEREMAKELSGVVTIGSGNKAMKGDVYGGNADAGQRIMAECKATEKRSISVKLDWLEKLVKEARESGREPVLLLRFDAAKQFGAHDWALLPKDRYIELLQVEAALKKKAA